MNHKAFGASFLYWIDFNVGHGVFKIWNSITITTLPVSQFSCSRPRETCDGTYPLTFVFLVLIRPLLWTSYWYTMGWKPFWRSMLIFYALPLISELNYLLNSLVCIQLELRIKFFCRSDKFSQNFKGELISKCHFSVSNSSK